jgi:hypothetical protein
MDTPPNDPWQTPVAIGFVILAGLIWLTSRGCGCQPDQRQQRQQQQWEQQRQQQQPYNWKENS